MRRQKPRIEENKKQQTSAYFSTSNNSLCFLLVVCCTHFYCSWRQSPIVHGTVINLKMNFYVIFRFVFPFSRANIPNNKIK